MRCGHPHRGAVAPTPGMGQGTSEAQEGKRSVCLHGEEEGQGKNAVLRGRPPHLAGVGPAGGMQAAWAGWHQRPSAALSVTLLGVDYIHEYSEDRRVSFLPG